MPPFENYVLGYKATVELQRYHDYCAGRLSVWEIAVLYQDLIEAEVIPPIHLEHALHFVEMGMCHIDQRALQ